MNQQTILVTNDDGSDSPTAIPLLDALAKQSWCREVRAVIPATEQSWIADAVTRFRPLRSVPYNFGAHAGFTVDGTPADCAQLGIHNLYGDTPTMAISGINVGTNAGLPFFLSSGTVGGATAAFLAGIPSIALSVHAPPEVFHIWRTRNFEKLSALAADWQRLANLCVQLVDRLLAGNAWSRADMFSVNLPWSANLNTEVVVTDLERKRFRSLFSKKPDGTFQHSFGDFSDKWVEDRNHDEFISDFQTVMKGMISITPIRYQFSIPSSERAALSAALTNPNSYALSIFTPEDSYSTTLLAAFAKEADFGGLMKITRSRIYVNGLCALTVVAGSSILVSSTARADDDLAKGKTIFEGVGACASCHGPAGAGDGPAAAALNPKPRNFTVGDFKYDTDADGKIGTEVDIANIIQNGAQKYGGSMMMTARPDIAEADRKALAKYVLSP